jgi:hypothetical protein
VAILKDLRHTFFPEKIPVSLRMCAGFSEGFSAFIVNGLQSGTIQLFERFRQLHPVNIHPGTMCLQHSHSVIIINNQPGKSVSFTENETVRIALMIAGEPGILA